MHLDGAPQSVLQRGDKRGVEFGEPGVGLPGEHGLSLTRYLREHSDAAIIIVTGRVETVDRIVGLEIAADDYLAKPFDLRELLARVVRSVLRRAQQGMPRGEDARQCVSFSGRQLDLGSRDLRSPDGSDSDNHLAGSSTERYCLFFQKRRTNRSKEDADNETIRWD